MKFKEFAEKIQQIESVSGRLEITQILGELFRELTPEELYQTAYLLQGRVTPLYVRADFSIAGKMAERAASSALATDPATFTTLVKQRGDLGAAVEEIKRSNPGMEFEELSISEVYSRLRSIPDISGQGSQEQKLSVLRQLLAQADPLSARYIVRIPVGALRLGFSDMTMLDAFSWMIDGTKSHRKTIEKAYNVRPDIGTIGRVLKENGLDSLQSIEPKVGVPILMMRAERCSSGNEILEKAGGIAAVEPKFDGIRLQIHIDKKNNVRSIYTRGLDEVGHMYPDVLDAIEKELQFDSIIIEGEIMGYNPDKDTFLPFQQTAQRKRKHNITEKIAEIPLKLQTFDLLYLNGRVHMYDRYTDRRKLLADMFHHSPERSTHDILLADSIMFTDGNKIETYFDHLISDGLEGIIAKKENGIYQAGARGWNWIKLKKSYAASAVSDTIDCVVMGYDYGKGKRSSFGIGAFLAGVYIPARDMFVTIAKIGTGLTDEEWRALKKRCDDNKSIDKPSQYEVDDQMSVDVWVTPTIVVEIRADEITRSSVHTAGRTLKPSKSGSAMEVDQPGYALRFPRLEKFRDDKSPGESTTLQEIITIAGPGS